MDEEKLKKTIVNRIETLEKSIERQQSIIEALKWVYGEINEEVKRGLDG